MSRRNPLTRLAAVAPTAEPILDIGEEDRILARILSSPRQARSSRPRTRVLALACLGVIGAAAVATSLELGRSGRAPNAPLTGATIRIGGFRFRTPAGFAPANVPCPSPDPSVGATGSASAAAPDGGCVQVAYVISPHHPFPIPTGSTPVDVGAYQGYFLPPDPSRSSTLYVMLPYAVLPKEGGAWLELLVQATYLNEDELIAIAQSGLACPPGSRRSGMCSRGIRARSARGRARS